MNFRNLSAWCIRNPVMPLVLFVGLMLMGVVSFINMDVQNQMRNAIDDLLYDFKDELRIVLTVEDMDVIVEKSLDIAKARYPR